MSQRIIDLFIEGFKFNDDMMHKATYSYIMLTPELKEVYTIPNIIWDLFMRLIILADDLFPTTNMITTIVILNSQFITIQWDRYTYCVLSNQFDEQIVTCEIHFHSQSKTYILNSKRGLDVSLRQTIHKLYRTCMIKQSLMTSK